MVSRRSRPYLSPTQLRQELRRMSILVYILSTSHVTLPLMLTRVNGSSPMPNDS
ncbi:hypothetical protein K503DRAFT_776100 [Rhizopogon vinicolor AM-OR11-026]|uniref:Uncharacterized protein n=1 Tax=Rhizopogon vinicolor AM-OR11-026 TaxID=1314800 RepID=A0A1B7MK41_9AGAM|nr:hypothetical protein K503DRAFT_776100 [Rhizopogon vinicolor AM-OR11-026]